MNAIGIYVHVELRHEFCIITMNFQEEMMHLQLGECLAWKRVNEIDALPIYLTIFKLPYVVEACC